MRINEITQLDEISAFKEKKLLGTEWTSPLEIKQWLISKNFTLLGEGAYGAAFTHHAYDKIIKISLKQDKCWTRFAHWTLKMTTNPAVPYIHWVHTYYSDEGTEFFIALIEKLEDFNRPAIAQTTDLPGLAYLYLKHGFDMDDWVTTLILKRFESEGILNDEIPEGDGDKAIRKYLKNAKGGKTFVNTLISAKKYAYGGCTDDIHEGNIMYRPSNKKLVVIDPLADLNYASW